MGCASSATNPNDVASPRATDAETPSTSSSSSSSVPVNYLVRLRGGPLTQHEYNSRLSGVDGTHTVSVPYTDDSGTTRAYQMRYATCSQRGYYPEAADKLNQDAYAALERFRGREDEFVFAVFDGHGECGTECAVFARDRVPMEMACREFGDVEGYCAAFEATNAALRKSDIDDALSGTTGIVAHIRGRELYVINVGDSRATMGMTQTSESGVESVETFDLSSDQTPFRKDECERVKQYGARVLTLDQLEGFKDPNVQCWGTEQDDDGDPPRLWASNGMYPGTAFTRSIGDAVAERIGVVATPEIEHVRLSKDTKCLVIASDGVFEFIPSASVVKTAIASEDPQQSAISLVVESYKLWLQYETRTDDITVIVLLFEGFFDEEVIEPQTPLQSVQSIGALFNFPDRAEPLTSPFPSSARPSRRVMPTFTMQTRRSLRVVHPYGISSDYHLAEDAGASALVAQLDNLSVTDADVSQLVDVFKSSFVFNFHSDDVLERLARATYRIKADKGQVVLRQNDKNALRAFYVVESGHYIGRDNLKWGVDDVNESVSTRSYGKEGDRMCFNEQCMIHAQLPHETVTAETEGVLRVLDMATFNRIARVQDDDDVVKLTRALRGVETLKTAKLSDLRMISAQVVANRANSLSYARENEIIAHQGQQLDAMHVIKSGDVACTVRANARDESEIPRVVLRLSSEQYFGERALSGTGVCATNIQAISEEVAVWRISKRDIESVLGTSSALLTRSSSVSNIDAGASLATSNKTLKSKLTPPERRLSFGDDNRATREALYVTLLGHMREMKGILREATVQISLARTESLGRVEGVLRERAIIKLLTSDSALPPSFIPQPGLPQKDSSFISIPYPFVPRCALEAVIACGGGSKPAVVRYYVAALTLVLEYIHKFDIVFRGIDPETMIISETGALRLVDFRFAKRLSASDASPGRTFTVCGAAAYMAPEVAAGIGHDERADWFSLGTFIAHMLRGSPPFGMTVSHQTFDAICACDVSKAFRDDADPDAMNLARQLLVADPGARLATARKVKQHPLFAGVDWDALAVDRPPTEVEELTRDQYRGRGVPPIRDATESSASSASWIETYMAFDSIAP